MSREKGCNDGIVCSDRKNIADQLRSFPNRSIYLKRSFL
ncbi:hypothetical protein ATPR_1973 [Acetobacter tropicalis NBRC 101654]|uniref:Uncharacterized protein n=1 Tax=Acetobacter tropicalis NBRC 101654 TaxID=749388 RepID=F7VF24_9PROT|nr:hypothetical protein ATPR_1973 [Acetobacter tropicalis NBRC 101654]